MTTSDTPETDAAVIASGGSWSFVLRETCRRLERERNEWAERWADLSRACLKDICALERERDEARELIKAYQEYTNLLGDEINDMTAVAYFHGWISKRYEQGKVLREKIKQLEGVK